MSPAPCYGCGGTGKIKTSPYDREWTPCPNCQPQTIVPSSNQPGKSRKTLLGFTGAIEKRIRDIVYNGDSHTMVFLYTRPGTLPSVKVTVELFDPGGVAAEVFTEESER